MSKFILLFVFGISIATVADDYRSFTDKEGRTIRAKVLKVDARAKKVTMERDNKKKTTVPIRVFSETDQEYINSWTPASSVLTETSDDSRWKSMVCEGESLIHEKNPSEAIEKYFDPVIEQFNSLNSTNSSQIYCARDSKESLLYLMQVALMSMKGEGEDVPEIWGNRFANKKDGAKVLPQFWAEAFFLKAYALIDLGQLNPAKETLQIAVGLSPMNANYLAELGHIYQLEKNWDMALEAYKAAEDSVSFSHPDRKDAELSRAWRGIGYVLVEQGKIDEAKEKYKQCLKLNPNDKNALAELKYIESL